MTNADRREFARHLAVLGEVYEKEISDQLAEVYFTVLAPYDIGDIAWAVVEVVKTSKYMPRPAELVELAQRRRREVAELRERQERDRRLALPQTPEDIENSKRDAAYWIAKMREITASVAEKRKLS